MFGEENNLRDSENSFLKIKDTSIYISYAKTDKLVMALYMVTEILDKEEPIRNKLRILGSGIISDIYLIKQNPIGQILQKTSQKVEEIMSFLDIAVTVNIVSDMNYNILKKEFSGLYKSIQDSLNHHGIKNNTINTHINLSEFFTDQPPSSLGFSETTSKKIPSKYHSIGHHVSTNIGLQRGSTLLKALSDRKLVSSMMRNKMSNTNSITKNDSFELLKKQRRDQILYVIKLIGGSATIKDIKDRANINSKELNVLYGCGEKTLQRELISMVKNGVLNKTGEKRWSRYFIK